MSCTQCDGVEYQFDPAAARRSLRKYRRRGPDRTTRLLIEDIRAALESLDARGTALLDIGAGVGVIQHELLDGRVASAVHVDASSAHMTVAREETERRGHGSRTSFVHGDFVALAETLAAADVVTLDRVICCYHDMESLVGRSARKASRLYGAVYPRGAAWMGLGIAACNAFMWLKRSPFRVFMHDPAAIDATLRAAGLERRSLRRTLGWEVVVYARPLAALQGGANPSFG